jgi:hypothetical protein
VTIPNTTATAVLRAGSNSIVDVTPHHLTTEWVELPRINYKLNGKMYKYFYAIGSNTPGYYVFPHASLVSISSKLKFPIHYIIIKYMNS